MPEQDWLPQDAAVTREYLNSPTGQKLLTALYKSIEFKNAPTLEEEAMNSREAKGGLKVITTLLAQSQEQQEQAGEIQFFNPTSI